MKNSSYTNSSRFSRRDFIKSSSAALALAAIPANELLFYLPKKRNRMLLSFYMDDTNPEIVKADAFKYFLDFCYGLGIRGESSVILGYTGKSIMKEPDDNQKIYLWRPGRLMKKGLIPIWRS
jgi:hypothetical protein